MYSDEELKQVGISTPDDVPNYLVDSFMELRRILHTLSLYNVTLEEFRACIKSFMVHRERIKVLNRFLKFKEVDDMLEDYEISLHLRDYPSCKKTIKILSTFFTNIYTNTSTVSVNNIIQKF
jgi:hypothetical protein